MTQETFSNREGKKKTEKGLKHLFSCDNHMKLSSFNTCISLKYVKIYLLEMSEISITKWTTKLIQIS